MLTIRIGGVPEHFNLPIVLGAEQGQFDLQSLDVRWTDCPGGTGAMCQQLREDTLDMAVLLTEGILKDITLGSPTKIIKVHVETPLKWGIHVAANSPIDDVDKIFDKHYAISRPNSGSHLIPMVHARQHGQQLRAEQFVEVGHVQGAETALLSGQAEVFFWEKFMTMPLIEKGSLRRIGECPTPWPCFVIAAQADFLSKHPEEVSRFLAVLNRLSRSFARRPDAADLIRQRYLLSREQVRQWLSETRWRLDNQLREEDFATCLDHLHALKLIHKRPSAQELWRQYPEVD